MMMTMTMTIMLMSCLLFRHIYIMASMVV